jgi:integrase
MNEEKKETSKVEIGERMDSIENKMVDVINKLSKKKKKNIRKIEVGPVVNEILTEEEYKHLLQVCNNSKHSLQNNFLVQTMIILGLRLGEVTHFKKSWVNFEKQSIAVPSHEPCDCSYCKGRLKAQLNTMDKSKEEQKSISEKEVMKYYWQPKTNAGVRIVYYGFDSEYEKILKDFFSKYDKWAYSYSAGFKRIRRLLDRADLKDHVPHHLRKTAGTNYAARGFTEQQLMDVMGWEDSKVAREYIRLYGPRSVEAQKRVLGDGKKKGSIDDSRNIFYLSQPGRQAFTRRKNRDEGEWLRDVLFSEKDDKKTSQCSLDTS